VGGNITCTACLLWLVLLLLRLLLLLLLVPKQVSCAELYGSQTNEIGDCLGKQVCFLSDLSNNHTPLLQHEAPGCAGLSYPHPAR
jgi:hypothetical protein